MQNTAPISKVTIWWRKTAVRLLAISWCLGIILGYLAAVSAKSVISDVVQRCVNADLSVVGVLAVTVLPFLMSAFAVSFSEPWLLLFLSTFKAFSFSFCAWGVCLAFGQSSWLVLFLFLFSDIFLIPALYFYWVRHIHLDRISIWGNGLYILYALAIFALDYWVIGPFLRVILK
jgi:hypothetical protein